MTNRDGETPLSDLIAVLAANDTPDSFARFIAAFRESILGVMAEGVPPGLSGELFSNAAQPISVGLTVHGDGKPRVNAFADPSEFVRRFGQRFNVCMTGEALMQTAMCNKRCAGILVNSAFSEVSVRIERATIASLIGPTSSRGAPIRQRPWWWFW